MDQSGEERSFRMEMGLSNGRIDVSVGEMHTLPEPERGGILIVDSLVHKLHGARFPEIPTLCLEASEANKSLTTVEKIYSFFSQQGVDRSSLVIGIGGGIVTDITGFAASTYLRGLDFGFVPTTLLAQVDAALGGKNGVNLGDHKNQVGLTRQPRFVLSDPSFLATLSDVEYRSGLAEAVKTAAVADAALFSLLERDAEALLRRDRSLLEKVIVRCSRVKYGIVSRDEHEKGERRILNFGHTLAHAIEIREGLPHGFAVAIGMAFAARLSVKRGLLSCADEQRLVALLTRLGLPTRSASGAEEVVKSLLFDKKRERAHVHFVLLHGLGHAVVEPLTLDVVGAEILEFCAQS